jgi:hypothetical protein
MLSTDEQKKICAEYSQRGADGLVRCNQCPLVISVYWMMCHANSHYDPNTCEFELDDCEGGMSAYPDGPMKERIK